MTYPITTIYPDGTTETRNATPEEIAQRETDIAEAARLKAEQDAWAEEQAAKRASAINKLTALGLTEEEANAIIR